MRLETERLLMRCWSEGDAELLYQYAKDERVGPIAGWPVHTSVENSRDIIKNVLSVKNTFAIVLKETGNIIGCISLMIGTQSMHLLDEYEAEVGYWLAVPYWGQGLMPEAVLELIRYGFEDLHIRNMWSGYYEGNKKSCRVQEKCGFTYHHTKKDIPIMLMNDVRTEHITFLSKETWLKNK